MRQEVLEFTRACEKLVIFAHQYDGLTKDECNVVVSFVRAVEKRVVPSPPQPDQVSPIPSAHPD